MSPQKRHDFTIDKKLCRICLTPHDKQCRYNFKCNVCNQDHNTLIHIDKGSTSNQVFHAVKPSEHNILLPTAKVLITDVHNNKYIVRALLDSGSQTSFCTTSLASKLGIQTFELHKNIITLRENAKKVSKGINLHLHSLTENFDVGVTCSIVDKITISLPQSSFDISKFTIPSFDKNKPLQCLQLQTITYGLTSSAFLATRCLVELANRYKDQYKLASEAILTSSYVDDVLCGSSSYQGAIDLKQELFDLLKLGGFDPHKWCSNDMTILQDIPKEKYGFQQKDLDQDLTVKTLGLIFDIKNDVFEFSGKVVCVPKVPTKRTVLSSVSKFFDPMGYVGPVVVKAKMILQLLWKNNLEWDAPLPSDLQSIWEEFHDSISNMSKLVISRDLHLYAAEEVELLGFCDASSEAYGCCLYLKVRTMDNNFYINLLCAKSRIVGLDSKLTIPKLELNGALLLSKLASKVLSVLSNVTRIFLFCDSKISLGSINTVEEKLPPYMANRVKEINKLTKGMTWKFIPGLLNPADILSRGGDPKDIENNILWWHGPDYLKDSCYNFQSLDIAYPYPTFEQLSHISNIPFDDCMMPFFTKFSSITKMQRVMSYVLRFINKCRKLPVNNDLITVSELQNSLDIIIRYVQHHYFHKEIECIKKGVDYKTNHSCYLKMLHPFIDDKGLLRVGGRLQNSNLPFTKKFPIILPKKCHVTRLIIRNEHLILLHGGLKIVSSSLSQRFFILNSMREIKSVIHKCITCTRYKAESAKQLMGSIPKERVLQARVFEKVGIDYCGPFEIKQSTIRRSIISKAIHLEVVSDMTSDSFISALKRFISRRGLPSDIFCDNAQTFKGADKQIKELYRLLKNDIFQRTITEYASKRGIQFHYIPAYSAHQGGLWEASVKSFKFHFKRILEARTLTFEQLVTLAIEIEAILNSRPLCPMSNDLTDFSILTPGHFLIGCPLISLPQPSLVNVPNNRLKFWRSIEQFRQHFWRAWSKDYLVSLNKRTKWQNNQPNIKLGSIVLLKDNIVHPQFWPLGRVVRLFPGKDSKVRVIEVMTPDKKIHSRAFTKIVVLPTDAID
ncbi:hypothetical protein ABMA27_010314 [Loxostege sticticalis]|uniref:Integrase catalytic domain-containing protein n=1 Tax=Loxostege sticticalis TaxID=481309 RepID=A0ABR3H5C2_LOXSC